MYPLQHVRTCFKFKLGLHTYMFLEALTTAKGRLTLCQTGTWVLHLFKTTGKRLLLYGKKSRPCKKNWAHVNSPLSYMPPIHVKIIIIVITISSTFQILIYDIGKCH